MKKSINLSLIASSLLLLPHSANAAEPIVISSIDWCPQLCNSDAKPGYIMDTVKAIFKDSPYDIQVKTYPWTRAIKLVETGKSHALLAPAKGEAPNLVFPTQEVGLQRMCFFTKSNTDWQYTGAESLKGMKVGLAQDTTLEGLDDYIASNKSQFDFIPYSDEYLNTSIKKVKFNRIDTFVFTYNSTQYGINERQLSDEYREAGCLPSSKVYMAFTPDAGEGANVSKMITHFDKRMAELKSSGEIKKIMAKYGLNDWQDYL